MNPKDIENQIGNIISVLEEVSVLQAEAKAVKRKLRKLQKKSVGGMNETAMRQLLEKVESEIQGIDKTIISKMQELNEKLNEIKKEINEIIEHYKNV